MTLANRITLFRAVAAIMMFVCMLVPDWRANMAALFLFAVAAFTDWLDGKIARETGTVTVFGAIADPFVDKLLVGAAFIGFASVRALHVPLWAVFIILAREMMVSSLRVLAALNGKVLAAEAAGKIKTAVQLVCAAVIMAVLNVRAVSLEGPADWRGPAEKIYGLTSPLPYLLTLFVALITLASGVSYVKNHWAMLKKSWNANPPENPV